MKLNHKVPDHKKKVQIDFGGYGLNHLGERCQK